MKSYYINLTLRDLTFPDWEDYPRLFRSLEYRLEHWWKRFIKEDGSGLTEILDPKPPLPRNLRFYRFEIATIIGNTSLSTYGCYIVPDTGYFLRALVFVCQDSPIGSGSLFQIIVNDVETQYVVSVPTFFNNLSEYVKTSSIGPISLNAGDSVKIKCVSIGTASCANLKVYGIFTQ